VSGQPFSSAELVAAVEELAFARSADATAQEVSA
jgi:hypothetical protein